jgi:hypothetical protein
MKSNIRLKASVIGVCIAAVAACGSAPSPTNSPPSPTAPTSHMPAAPGDPARADAGTVIDVTIDNGVVAPTNGQAQSVAGEPIVLQVSSDTVDSLHVHSVPEYTFDVAARPDQRFEFTVEVPGRVAVELHDLHLTVVTIEVRP